MTRAALTVALVSMVVGVALFGPRTIALAPADAFACSVSSHCYGVSEWDPATSNDAAISVIDVHHLTIGNQCTDFVTNEMWEGTSNSASYWVESGASQGVHNGGACGNGNEWYWADNRPNGGGYHEHYTGTFSPFNNYTIRIAFDGCSGGVCTWEVDRNGSAIGYSNGSPCCSTYIAAGSETTTSSTYDDGEAFGLQKRINGVSSYGWSSSFANIGGIFSMGGDPHSDFTWYHCC